MLKKLTSERQMRFLCFLCCLVYFMSYMTRLNYAACMVEIQNVLQVGKSIAGLPVTMCFLSYGAGQLVCGFLGDKYSPRRMIFTGLAGSSCCNLLVMLFPGMEVMIPVWCANGFFQSMLWPPMVRVMAEMLSDKWYRQSCVLVSMASTLATLAIYVFAPVCIQFSGWKTAFAVPGVLGILTAVFWLVKVRKLEADHGEKPGDGGRTKAEEKGGSALHLLAAAPLVPILLAIILQGTLRDGMTTWMPVYMNEVFGMNSSKSILSAAALPVFGTLCILFASLLLGILKSEVFTAMLLFGAGAFAGAVMLPFYDSASVVCIIMMTVITGSMYGVNLLLISRVPGHFAGYGKVSTVSGVLNAATYIGSSLSTYGFGAVAEGAGWRTVVILWIAIAVLGALLMLAAGRRWAAFCKKQK